MKTLAPIATAVLTIVLAIACGDDETTSNTTQSSTKGSGANGSTTTTTTGGSGGTGGSSSMGGAGGTGGMGMGGGNAMACNACAQMQFNGPQSACWEVFTTCSADPICGNWFNCSQECQEGNFNAACFDACNTDAAGGRALYQPVLDCLCASCSDPCAPACN
jgi:hypothetical protein